MPQRKSPRKSGIVQNSAENKTTTPAKIKKSVSTPITTALSPPKKTPIAKKPARRSTASNVIKADTKIAKAVKSTPQTIRKRTKTEPKLTTPKTKEVKVLTSASVTKTGNFKKRPQGAHSGVPVPDKMKKLFEKDYIKYVGLSEGRHVESPSEHKLKTKAKPIPKMKGQ